MRRLLVAILLVGVGIVASQGFAAAQVYPPAGATLDVDPSIIGCNDSFVASGAGWLPGTTVTFTLASTPQTLGSVTASGSGTFSQSFKSSTTLDVGQHTVTASGLDAAGVPQNVPTLLTVSTCVGGEVATRVRGTSSTRSGSLAFTGSDNTGLIVGIAVLLVLIGTALVVAFARRRRAYAH